MPWTYLPYDLEINIVRTYVGPGRGPRCSRGESPILAGAGAAACLVDTIVAANIGTVTVKAPEVPVPGVCDPVPAEGCPPGFDRDQDGLSTCEETCIYGTDPLRRDTDADGLPGGEGGLLV